MDLPTLHPVPTPAAWRGRRVLVAGGSGFLGRRTVARLRELGAEVASCSRGEGCDLRDREQAAAAFGRVGPELVINLAANQGGVAYQRLCPATILHDNVLIVVNTMEAARLAGASHYVNVVAACAYPGETPDGLLREEAFDAGPMHASADNYGISRRLAVLQARHYRGQYGLQTTSVVLANTYGPGDHFEPERSHVPAALVRRFYEARRDRRPEVVVWGRGLAERDFLYLDDAVEGLLLAAERQPAGELLNIGTGRPCSIAALAETIRAAVGFEGRVVFDPDRPEGPLKKTLDVTRLQALLGWLPPTPLEVGVRQTLAWYAALDGEATGPLAQRGRVETAA